MNFAAEPYLQKASYGRGHRPFRILSLDGGGVLGAFTASVLATIEERSGERVVDHFDLITGTSNGGIIAVGLGMGMSAREICEFYRERGSKIFPHSGLAWRIMRILRHLALGEQETLKEEHFAVIKQRFLNGQKATPFEPIQAVNPMAGRLTRCRGNSPASSSIRRASRSTMTIFWPPLAAALRRGKPWPTTPSTSITTTSAGITA